MSASPLAKPSYTGSSMAFLPTIGSLLFVATLVVSGGLFIYDHILSSQITDASKALVLAKASFDPETMNQLITASNQIQSAKRLLDSHVAVSGMFALLEANVLPGVSFTSFEFQRQPDNSVKISLEGQGSSYATLAEQAQIFSKLPYLQKQTFSEFTLTDKGTIAVKFQAMVDPNLISYKQALQSMNQ